MIKRRYESRDGESGEPCGRRFPGPILMLGMPGAGKGTQARFVSERCGVPHISTGEMLRGLEAHGRLGKYLQGGRLTPDPVVCELVEARLAEADCEAGFVLDGFPRTLAQAEWIRGVLGARAAGEPVVLYLTLGYNDLYCRLSGRRTCEVCGKSYHQSTGAPREAGRCDQDGGRLIRRSDDAPELVRERLEEFERSTLPVVEYFRRQGWLHEIRGSDPVERVSAAVFAALEGGGKRDDHV